MTEFESYRGGEVVYQAIRLDNKSPVFHAAHQEIHSGMGMLYRTSCGHICVFPYDWRDQCGVQLKDRCPSCRWSEPPQEPRP